MGKNILTISEFQLWLYELRVCVCGKPSSFLLWSIKLSMNKGTKDWFWRMNGALVHTHGHSRTALWVTEILPLPLLCFSRTLVSMTVKAIYFMKITIFFFLDCPKRWKILVPSLHLSPVCPFLHLPFSRKQKHRVANFWVAKYWFHAN